VNEKVSEWGWLEKLEKKERWGEMRRSRVDNEWCVKNFARSYFSFLLKDRRTLPANGGKEVLEKE
jgi:hypothetical protein